MKKNAFTLVELLGVIIVLAIISLLTVPVIDKTMKDAKEKAYNTQIANIELAAKNWAIDNMEVILNRTVSINLGQLKIESYIDNDIKNPKTNEKFSDNIMIKLSYLNRDYVPKVYIDEEISSFNNNYVATSPYVVIIGDAYEHIARGSTYQEAGALIFNANGNTVNEVAPVYTFNGATESTVNTNSRGKHVVTFAAEYNGNTIKVNKIVNVD